MENLIAINIAVPEGISGRCCAGCIFYSFAALVEADGCINLFHLWWTERAIKCSSLFADGKIANWYQGKEQTCWVDEGFAAR